MRKSTKIAVGGALATMAVALPATSALGATGTSTVSFTAGTLSVGTVTNETVTEGVATTGNGILPQAVWADTTGSGKGWNGTVALSDLTFTGTWAAQGSATALTNATSGAFTDTTDGVSYTVSVGAGGTGLSTPVTWTSSGGADTSGSATCTNGSACTVGTKGITITFTSGTTYTSGWQYLMLTGTQTSSAVSLLTSATGAAITPGSGRQGTAPVFTNNTSTVTGGGVSAT